MEEHLVEYLLGSLDPVTQARVENHLQAHPEARRRLALLQQALAPLAEDAAPPEPPPGLVLSTLARIAEQRCTLPSAPNPVTSQAVPPRRSFRPIDWIVAACLLLVVGGLALPFSLDQWRMQQRHACSDNLRRFWVALAAYGDLNENEFPRVERNGSQGVAGIFLPILTDSGLAQDVSVGCAALGHRSPPRYTVAELARMHDRAPEEYHGIVRDLAGDYAYSLGYEDGGKHRGLRRDSGDGLPIMADRSAGASQNSMNHRGLGQNVLYVGGHVRWAVEPTVGEERDDIYVNHHRRVQAGVCRIDSVLGASDARPYVGE